MPPWRLLWESYGVPDQVERRAGYLNRRALMEEYVPVVRIVWVVPKRNAIRSQLVWIY